MRIARPLLLVATPLGVVAGLLAALLVVVGGLCLFTWRTIRRESR
jgi:hypothetical protein